METALFFGSFNPIHRGHTAIAQALLDKKLCDEVWFVVSPLNPLKDRSLIIDKTKRLKMVALALSNRAQMSACDVEFSMPEPSYTIDTLKVLSARFADRRFSIIMGSDNIAKIREWKNFQEILDNYKIIVYPRAGFDVPEQFQDKVILLDNVDILDVSSTQIRNAVISCNGTDKMLDSTVKEYITDNGLWGAQSCKTSLIHSLTQSINKHSDDPNLYLERGIEYQKTGEKDKALNDFIRVLELDPANKEAAQRAEMLKEIFEYAYREIYNP